MSAPSMFSRIVEKVDVLVGNEEDLQKALGIVGPDAAGGSKLDPAASFETINRVVDRIPNIKVVATTLRDVSSTNRHAWSAVAWINGEKVMAPTCHLDVLDRVGGGDGFASGMIYGMLTGESPEQCVRLGCAHGALQASATISGLSLEELHLEDAVLSPCVDRTVWRVHCGAADRRVGPGAGPGPGGSRQP